MPHNKRLETLEQQVHRSQDGLRRLQDDYLREANRLMDVLSQSPDGRDDERIFTIHSVDRMSRLNPLGMPQLWIAFFRKFQDGVPVPWALIDFMLSHQDEMGHYGNPAWEWLFACEPCKLPLPGQDGRWNKPDGGFLEYACPAFLQCPGCGQDVTLASSNADRRKEWESWKERVATAQADGWTFQPRHLYQKEVPVRGKPNE